MKEPITTFAPATADSCIAHCNLSATMDHYGTYNNLGSTATDACQTYDNLSAIIDLESYGFKTCGTGSDLSSTNMNPL